MNVIQYIPKKQEETLLKKARRMKKEAKELYDAKCKDHKYQTPRNPKQDTAIIEETEKIKETTLTPTKLESTTAMEIEEKESQQPREKP